MYYDIMQKAYSQVYDPIHDSVYDKVLILYEDEEGTDEFSDFEEFEPIIELPGFYDVYGPSCNKGFGRYDHTIGKS